MSCGRPPPLAADIVDCGMGGLRAALTAPSGLDEGFMLLGLDVSIGFRNEGSRRGAGLEGLAKSLVAESAAGVCSGDVPDGMGSLWGEAINAMLVLMRAAEETRADGSRG